MSDEKSTFMDEEHPRLRDGGDDRAPLISNSAIISFLEKEEGGKETHSRSHQKREKFLNLRSGGERETDFFGVKNHLSCSYQSFF
jgi:hypothetical protein